MKVKCNEIKIGNRVRKDLGDIENLANNIKELGLLQPIGITKDNELVFGERRLAACRLLNHEEINVVVIDSDELLECETTENVNRKNFVMSERVEIRALFKDKFIRKKGKLMTKGIKIKKTGPESGPKYLQNRLANLSGVSRDTANKENVIVAFGNQSIINQIDNNELSVNKAYCLIKKMKKELEAAETNNSNKINDLLVEEMIDPVEEPIQIDNNIYTIAITDNYGSLELPKDLSNAIKYFSEGVKGLPKEIIKATLSRDFKAYI